MIAIPTSPAHHTCPPPIPTFHPLTTPLQDNLGKEQLLFLWQGDARVIGIWHRDPNRASLLDPAWIPPGSLLDPSWIPPGSLLDPSWIPPGSLLDLTARGRNAFAPGAFDGLLRKLEYLEELKAAAKRRLSPRSYAGARSSMGSATGSATGSTAPTGPRIHSHSSSSHPI